MLIRDVGVKRMSGLLKAGRGGVKLEAKNLMEGSFELGAHDQSEPGFTNMDFMLPAEEALESLAETAEAPDGQGGDIEWGDVQDAILNVYIADGQVWGGPEMVALSKRLKTHIDEFELIRDQTVQGVWDRKRMERLLEIERVRMGRFNWDKVEQVALAKMMHLVETRTLKLPELLAISATANRATRRGPTGQPTESQGGNVVNNTQVNLYGLPAAPGTPELPGAGSLGSIKLNLSQRTVKQLSEEKVIDAEYERLSERVEMLEASDIPELTKQAESEKND
jgi:hypothetical protein